MALCGLTIADFMRGSANIIIECRCAVQACQKADRSVDRLDGGNRASDLARCRV